MKTFYKWLLSIGIAMGVFFSLIVFSAGQRQWSAIQLRDKMLRSDIYKIINKPEADYVYSLGLDTSKQIQTALPEGCLSDVEANEYGANITYGKEPLFGAIIGTGSNYSELMKMELVKGRFYTTEDVDHYNKVCVIKSSLSYLININANKYITINGEDYEIIGVITDQSEESNIIFPGDIYIPVTTLYKEVVKTDEASKLVSKIVFNKGDYTQDQVEKAINQKADEIKCDISDLEVMQYHSDEFSIVNEFIKSFLVIFIISLLILIISVLNIIHIATASIIDREREIGLRTALGASSAHIIKQICLEIALCSLQGGLLGIAISSIVNTILNYYFKDFSLSFNIITIIAGVGLSGLAGLVSSLIPANKAARIDPIAALREE